jgi:hypothetical protein
MQERAAGKLHLGLSLSRLCSGRDAIFIAPPAQNRTGGFPAYGLYGTFFVKGASIIFVVLGCFIHLFDPRR